MTDVDSLKSLPPGMYKTVLGPKGRQVRSPLLPLSLNPPFLRDLFLSLSPMLSSPLSPHLPALPRLAL